MAYSYKRTAGRPRRLVPYQEGDLVEADIRGWSEIIRVEDKAQIRGKPGFIGYSEEDGSKVTGLDEQVLKVRRRVPPDGLFVHGDYGEILDTRIDGQTVYQEIHKFLKTVVVRGQEVAKLVDAARKQYAKEYGEGVDLDKFEQILYKGAVKPVFGEDPLARALARALARGDYLF